ncbi:protein farnesyltransferase subunit beta-like [Teleopsis dalmanni]|uniref:protein farnesyltransferase subunit beta-like n=1 Tax=Teleopsis dalmanni TaxID=139649 RepID=UPI000D32D080|nr:protein farnesyltransferase subunit beta-like [Teleopsis dalmanni]XP_037945623.1 protein farnesyltransferase subunit beta-like [Teleopsis dalmanni]XP_037945624.1 protein farnesyltransferase subunit beta-like [Teleopsis dalmanni]XP_037946337.1 protein farnesyltransferase subunit beta-like [Teleopsis dalmanni]XP_037946340.1 protein farnesyltransferase subunit beta-like [Teleopsis dalmanni]
MDNSPEMKFRNFIEAKVYKFDDEKVSTVTSRDQKKTENSIEKCFDRFQQLRYLDPKVAKFYREEHQRMLESMIHRLPNNYECLDSSRPWNLYWILQASNMLSLNFSDELLEDVVQFLIKCRSKDGGFAGGPGQFPHLATSYAAINCLCMIGTNSAYVGIDRDSLTKFLFSVREPNGAFRLHVDGETDVRGAYCAIVCASLAKLPENVMKKLFDKTGAWISSCQTYEGGFGGAPDLEAHGGYTYCGIAALALLNETDKCDTEMLLKWNLQRQMSYEGGFQGRTNKLVDGCYSFWVGASILITQAIINKSKKLTQSIYDAGALQEYILLCCQKKSGGLIDKPGKPQDLYHTCYTLSGVSIAQHSEFNLNPQVLGDPINELMPTHPMFNIPPFAVSGAIQYFDKLNELQENLRNNCDATEYFEIETESRAMEIDQEDVTEDEVQPNPTS